MPLIVASTDCSSNNRISEGQYYEAHQQLRVIAARYTKASNWSAAIDVLYSGSMALLKAGQGGSGGDLALLLVDTLNRGEVEVGGDAKGELPRPFDFVEWLGYL